MTEYNQVLKKILAEIDGDFTVTDEEYEFWKKSFEELSESDKVFNLLGVISQYLLSEGGRTAGVILASAIICTSRWCGEKNLDDF